MPSRQRRSADNKLARWRSSTAVHEEIQAHKSFKDQRDGQAGCFSPVKRQREYQGYRHSTPRAGKSGSSMPILLGAAMIAAAIPVVDADQCARQPLCRRREPHPKRPPGWSIASPAAFIGARRRNAERGLSCDATGRNRQHSRQREALTALKPPPSGFTPFGRHRYRRKRLRSKMIGNHPASTFSARGLR